MKLKTLLIVPLLIVGLLYIGTKGYIYYKTKDGLNKIIELAAPIVQLDYTDAGSDLSGSIYVENIRITPTGTYDEITIQELKISGNDFKFLLDLARGFSKGKIPPQMTIAFHRLESPVSSSLLSNMASSFSKGDKRKKITKCSIPGILNAVGLKELGISSIRINGSLGYTFDNESSQAEFNLRYDLAGVESSLIDIKLSQLSAQGVMGLGKLPIVEQFRMVRQFQPEYIKQIVEHCATEASLATTTFVDDLFTQSDEYYIKTLGFVPGPGLSELFRQLITNAGTVEINATPSSEISPALLKAYRPEDLIDLFGVTASYNGTPITDLSFSMQSSAPKVKPKSPTRATSITTPSSIETATKIKKASPKPKPKLRYLDTDVSDLKNYINYQVRAYTLNNDIPKTGILASITDHTLHIEHLLFHGKMTSHLNVDRIEHIEVLRKEESEDK